MKKSLLDALSRAFHHSLKFPTVIVSVLDKPYKRSVVVVSDWMYRELLRDGWILVASYSDGRQEFFR